MRINAVISDTALSTVPTYPLISNAETNKEGKGSPYSIIERRVPELIPVLAVSLQVT